MIRFVILLLVMSPTLALLNSLHLKVTLRPTHARRHTFWMSEVPLDTGMNNTASNQASRRDPAYPMSAYHLAVDERRLKYNFVSFIDYSPAEPYSQVTRLVEPRSYARSDQFDKDMMDVPPTIDDVAPPPSLYGSLGELLAWNKLPARAVVGTLAYLCFPPIVATLEYMTRDVVERESLLNLVNTFLPGVSIVLGTFFSLTLGILYDRFTRLQETVSLEASLLALTCQNLLDLFHNDQDAAVEGAQCIADQVRTLVRESRGREIMGVIYSDPYKRILQLCMERNEKGGNELDSVCNSKCILQLYLAVQPLCSSFMPLLPCFHSSSNSYQMFVEQSASCFGCEPSAWPTKHWHWPLHILTCYPFSVGCF